MRRRPIAGIAVLLLAVAGLLAVPAGGQQPKGGIDTIQVGPNDDRLWPYTSRSTSVEGRTLVLNVIVMADPKTVEAMLSRRAETDWTTTDRTTPPEPTAGPFPATRVDTDWQSAHGSVRYTYAETSKHGQWLKQRYQLHVGTYLGTRDHIRAFAPGEQSEWTALQAHSEYWDWFRLRHTVTDVRGTATRLEAEFDSLDRVGVERRHRRDSGPLSRGIVVVSSLLPILAARRGWSRLTDRAATPGRRTATLTVFAIALTTPLAVRAAGIGLELLVPLVNPKLFVVMLYPLLAVGLPAAVARRSAALPARTAGPVAAVALVVGFAAEFAFLWVAPPERLAWHRLLVAAALGLLAAGGGELRGDGSWRPLYTLGGAVLWLCGLLAPLFGAF